MGPGGLGHGHGSGAVAFENGIRQEGEMRQDDSSNSQIVTIYAVFESSRIHQEVKFTELVDENPGKRGITK